MEIKYLKSLKRKTCSLSSPACIMQLTNKRSAAGLGLTSWFTVKTTCNVGYLPTTNTSATDVSTVNEALNQPLAIMQSLHLSKIICVFDKAIYGKAFEVKCKEHERFKPIVICIGTFHTLCTLIPVISKRFQDAGLKDLFIEAGVVAEGSVSAVLEGRNYNRAACTKKLAYEAFTRVAHLKGFIHGLTICTQKIVLLYKSVLMTSATWLMTCVKKHMRLLSRVKFSSIFQNFLMNIPITSDIPMVLYQHSGCHT